MQQNKQNIIPDYLQGKIQQKKKTKLNEEKLLKLYRGKQ